MIPQEPRKRAGVLCDTLTDGTAVLYDPATDMVYELSSSGAQVWYACDGNHAAAEIGRLLVDSFDVDQATASRDVAAFLQALERLGLLEFARSSA